jgi:hypothetical protein
MIRYLVSTELRRGMARQAELERVPRGTFSSAQICLPGALQQLQNQWLGFFEVAGQKPSLRARSSHAEHQLILAALGLIVEQGHAGY